MLQKNVIKLITFDITGTILKLRYPVGEIYSNLGNAFGIQSKPELLNENFKKGWMHLSETHPNFGLQTGIGWEEWWKHLIHFTFFENNCKRTMRDSKKISILVKELILIFSTKEGWELTEGTIDLLGTLKEKRLVLGVLSNFDPRLHMILKSFDIQHYFDFVITSYDCGYMKPSKEIFKMAEMMYGIDKGKAINPGNALHVGDSLEIDGVGAIEAGWNSILITKNPLPCNKVVSSEMVFKNITELNKFLCN